MSKEKVSELISYIMTAISSCSLYSEKHAMVKEFCGKAFKLIQDLFVDDSASLLMIGDSFIFNDTPVTGKSIHITNFLKILKRKKIEKIIIQKGLNAEEFLKFIISMSSRDIVSSSPHIAVGIIEVRFKTPETDSAAILEGSISKVKDSYLGISAFKKLDMVGLEDAVVGFISTMKKELNVLSIVSPVKSHSEYTYVHATNVSVLTIFQAESLGLKGEYLHDIGLAGLLHDVGKMFVSSAVLEKKSKLDEDEWFEMRKHPVYGAVFLSKLPDVPHLTAVAAFEHHMKFDGSGYPETKRIGKKQHLISQMIAIADFFDAMRTERPYRKSLNVHAISGLMKEGAGKDFNPHLVDNFLSSLGKLTDNA